MVGIWHLGIINAVGFAEKGYRVIGLEFDASHVKNLANGIPPLFEPGVERLLRKHIGSGRLVFSSHPQDCRAADYVVIAYDSPVNEEDEVDITPVAQAAVAIAPYLRSNTPVVITSQVPLGTSEVIEATIQAGRHDWKSGVVYTPENLKLGTAIDRFLNPDMLVLGTHNVAAKRAALALYKPFRTKKLWTDLRTAEMVKHALNAYLATSISFINEIAHLADKLQADAVTVGQALKLDKRIGKRAPLAPGLGFSGGTLARDMKQLQVFARNLHYDAKLLTAVTAVNETTFDQIVMKLQQVLGPLAEKNIGLLGLTYKPGTSTMRRSPALVMMQKLAGAQAHCFGYDPMADQAEMDQYQKLITRVDTVEDLAKRSDVLVLVTEWPQFQKLPYDVMAEQMRQPTIIDTKNFLDPTALTTAGFRYLGFGRHGTIHTYEQHRHHRRRVAGRAKAASHTG